MDSLFDAIIIGGSYAGLAAGLTLGRSLRNTLIIDSGLPCNRQTPHSHNFLTQDGKTPRQIAQLARQQVALYESVQFYEDLALSDDQRGMSWSMGRIYHPKYGKFFKGKMSLK
ncbi:MAG: NAD(P)/FAD-dependent oxidoreductase, partial [Bacteroidota bacterium]